ncbi:hypothetical protein LVJ94_01300 [Pendulispora rubella]|uniref:Chromosome partition protein Smc n=1 Tax=Pendulispora rubella TaxID=2741070 RepID=A0ABZ2L4P3_9BACT
MNVMSVIWLASLAAAALFAAAGYFLARARIGRQNEAQRRHAEQAIAELAQAELRAKHNETVAAAARADAERSAQELTRAAESEQRARLLLDEQRHAAEEQRAEATRLQRELDQLVRTRGEVARLEKELATVKSRTQQLESRGTEGEVLATKKLVELASTVSTLRGQLESKVKFEQEVRGGLDSARHEADALRREAALRAEETRAAKEALEAARTDTVVLRQESATLAEMKKRVAALEADNARLRAVEFASKAKEGKKISLPSPTLLSSAPAKPGLDGHSLQRFVDDAVRSPSVSAAALTDELGFLVASNGDHAEALAAFGAYLTEAGGRACGLLPMHAVQRVSVQDDTGITLTARTVASAPNELVLVTLGVEGGREKLNGQRERTS